MKKVLPSFKKSTTQVRDALRCGLVLVGLSMGSNLAKGQSNTLLEKPNSRNFLKLRLKPNSPITGKWVSKKPTIHSDTVPPLKSIKNGFFSNIKEITITASKFPKELSETGKVVDFLGIEELKKSEGSPLVEVLESLPGIGIDGLHVNPGFAPKTIFIQGAGGDYTLVLIDGIPVSDPSSLGSNFDIRLVNADQFERIEVLKGGQSTLYGSDAVAGVINLISKTPKEKGLKITGLAEAGSYGSFKESIGVNHLIVPLLDYSASFTHFKTNGLIEALDTTGKAGFHRDGLREDNFLAKANWLPGKWKISPSIRFSSIVGLFSGGAYTDGINPYSSKNWSGALSIHFPIYQGPKIYFNEGFTYTQRYYGGLYTSQYAGRFNQAELYLEQKMGNYLQILGGIHTQFEQVLDTASASIKINPSITLISPYFSLFLNHFYGFNVSLGARYTHNSAFGDNVTYNLNPSFIFPNSHIKFFVDYATSFRAPKLPELFGEFGANPGLQPETSQSWEAGMSGLISLEREGGAQLSYRLLAFNRSIKKAIVYLFPKGYLNQDEQNDKGLELSGNLKLNPQILINASYSLLLGQVKTLSMNTGQDTVFNNLIRRPKNTLHLNLQFAPSPSWNIGISYSCYSGRYDEDFNTGNFVPLLPYSLLDAHIGYSLDKKGRIHVYSRFSNLLDKSYTEIIGYNTMRFNFNTGIQIQFL